MQRTLAAMVVCLVVGAGGMWVLSNFRLKVEAVGGEPTPPPPTTAKAESPLPLPALPVAVVPPPSDPPQPLPPNLLPPLPSAPVPVPPPVPTPDVKPASASLPVGVAATALGVGQPSPPPPVRITAVREKIDGRDVYWAPGEKVLVAGTSAEKEVVLVLEDAPTVEAEFLLYLNDAPPDKTPAAVYKFSPKAGSTPATVTLFKVGDANWPKGVVKVGVGRKDGLKIPAQPDRTVELAPPGPAAGGQLLVSGYLDSPYLTAAKEVPDAGGTAIPVRNGYLRVKGQTQANAGTVEFLTVPEPNAAAAVATPVPAATQKGLSPTTGEWEYELSLGRQPNNAKGFLLCRAVVGDTHYYSPKLIPVQWLVRNTPGKPAFAADPPVSPLSPRAKDDAASTAGQPAYRATQKAFTVTVVKPADAQVLLLFVGDQTAPAQAKDLSTEGGANVTFTGVGVPGSGDHVVSVAGVNGNSEVGPRAKFLLKVQTTGPQAVSVSAPGFGTNPGGRETISVQFVGERLDPASFQGGAGFALEHDQAAGGAKPRTFEDVKYDPTANIVRLTYSGIVPGTYTFKVLKKTGTDPTAVGVRDLFGNFLVGPNGTGVDDAVFALTAAVAQETLPSVSAGVTLQTGPNVTFPEYTRFRRVEDGFNPSDRVETRVVRLYYTRDAHRVAQIVNRDVRSYNAASVDVRRRAADRARDEANIATDARKRLEGEAVQAAVDARAAETRLRDLQARLTTARTEAATANTQLSQRQGQLDQFVRAGTRDQTNVGVRRDIDTSADAAQARLDRLTADVTQAEAAVTAAKQSTSAKPSDLDTALIGARKNLDASQQDFRVEYADRRAAAEQTNAVVTANGNVGKLEADRRKPGLSPEQLARLDADLAAAVQQRDEAIQTAILRADTGGVLRTKSEKVQTDQLALEQLLTAREALVALPTLRQAQADAQRDLDRAKAVARGRAATDPGADVSLDTAAGLRAEVAKLTGIVANTTAMAKALEEEIARATGEAQAKRTKEVELNLRAREYEQQELRGRENQFRREVAAAREDPDTYAAGVPTSDDPVRQCSISVIGEGLIQLRGPVKGLNVIRTMINQMDAPTGQVRIGVHTVQVNGERVERMDKVVASIQRYLDHSRFLTVQSAQMLRKAVTLVASRKAEEATMTVAPGCSRAEQEQKYLYSFFGKDFVEELRQLDSEFLRTGNKLLSLHSMDSTSLSAALFLLALAKNDIRLEILQEWQSQLQGKLPQAEMNFYQSGLACADKCEACGDKKFCVLAQNAKFESFLGFFNGEVQGTDTLTPVQREFVRLAQIFKTRLVTELELKQRVLERTLLEERIGRNYLDKLREADQLEQQAKDTLVAVRKTFDMARQLTAAELVGLEGPFSQVETAFAQFDAKGLRELFLSEARKKADFDVLPLSERNATGTGVNMTTGPIRFFGNARLKYKLQLVRSEAGQPVVQVELDPEWLPYLIQAMNDIDAVVAEFRFFLDRNAAVLRVKKVIDELRDEKNPEGRLFTLEKLDALANDLATMRGEALDALGRARETNVQLIAALSDKGFDTAKALDIFARLKADSLSRLQPGGRFAKLADEAFGKLDKRFAILAQESGRYAAALRDAQAARRPLDEKKLLDMLVDEMEDKFIELLDGTRAHTANVDNYLKALATALDDDFNTQFYQPAFRKIRTLGAGWDVQLGQIESTTVLTNNRVLGKVSPAASMEFDLPRRSILIKEAMEGAKAAVQDYGALLNDPVFLSMVKMYSGVPPAAQFGGASGGLPAVRGVLPGLPTSADEMLLAQAGSPRREFGTNLEALIPDPAIYKFETGTGYEIRPVISPDGQAVVFNFDYMYTTDVREPVRADEKHLGRVRRHFVHTDVQLGNYEMREVSKYWVSLKAARTGQGVQLLQDIPGVGALFRPAPSASSSLQQNLIYSQAAIFPTLFDLMGLRYAPAVADIDPEFTKNDEFVVRGRRDYLRQFIFDYGASRVDDALRIMYGERRPDLYRSQHTIPWVHPNGYQGPGLRQRDAQLEEGYDPLKAYPPTKYAPGMHTPLQPDCDPADPFGMPARPLTVPGGGYSEYGSRPMPHGGYSPLQAKPPTAVAAGKEPTVKPPTGIGTAKVYTAKPISTLVTPEPAPKPPAPTVTPLTPDRLPPPTTPSKTVPTPAAPISIRPENNNAPLPAIPVVGPR